MEITRPTNVTQHNHLINGQYKLSYLEMRLFIVLLSRIEKGQKEFKVEKIKYEDFMPSDMEGGSAYENAKEAYERFINRWIKAKVVAYDRDRKASLEDAEIAMVDTRACEHKRGYLALKFSEAMKPYVLELRNNFTKSYLQDLLSLNTAYAARIYMLLDQYSTFGTRVMRIEELKDMLMLPDSYKWSHIEEKVIKPSQKDLEKTRRAFDYSVPDRKKGKAVEAVRFELKNPPSAEEQEQDRKKGKTIRTGKQIPLPIDIPLKKEIYSETQLRENYEHNFSRGITQITDFRIWVQKIYPDTEWERKIISDEWHVLKR